MKKITRCFAIVLAFVMLCSGSGLQQISYAKDTIGEGAQTIVDGDKDTASVESPKVEDQPDGKQDTSEILPEEESKEEPSGEAPVEEEKETANKEATDEQPTLEPRVKALSPLEEMPLIKAETDGILKITIIGGAFNPDQKAELEVIYKPKVDGNNKYMEITGIRDSGLELATAPIVENKIIKVETLENRNRVRIWFADTLGTDTSISFRLQVSLDTEKTFVDRLDPGSNHITGIIATEYIESKVYQTTNSDFPISYTMKKDDLATEEFAYDSDLGYSLGRGMSLWVSAQEVDALDGSGWVNKEATYELGVKNYEGAISQRYIKNLRMEIPLPNNITFISSDYSVGKDDIKISYDGSRNYLILECDTYSPGKPLKFTMTLNFEGLNMVAGVSKDRGWAYGVDNWHNFYSNYTNVPGRNESGRPWKLEGNVYGVFQQIKFYDRSKIIPDSLSSERTKYGFIRSYTYTETQRNVNVSSNQIGEAGDYDIIDSAVRLGEQGYKRRVSYKMDQPIRIKEIQFDANILKRKGLEVTFKTNKEKVDVYSVANVDNATYIMKAPLCKEGEYIKEMTVVVDENNKLYTGIALKVDVLDTDLEGNKLPVDARHYIRRSSDIPEYGNVAYESAGPAIYKKPIAAQPTVNLEATKGAKWDSSGDYLSNSRFIFDRQYTDVTLISITNDGKEEGGYQRQNLTNIEVDPGVPRISRSLIANYTYPIFQLAGKSAATLSLEGYKDLGDLPDITVTVQTKQGPDKDILIPASAFHKEATGSFKAKVEWGVSEDDYLEKFMIKVSKLPISAKVTMTADHIDMRKPILPDGTNMEEVAGRNEHFFGELQDLWNFIGPRIYYFDESGKKEAVDLGTKSAAIITGSTGLQLSRIVFSDYYHGRPDVIAQGQEIKTEFQLADVAFNPTYGFEVDGTLSSLGTS